MLTIHTLEDTTDDSQSGHCKAGLEEQSDENQNYDNDIASKESTEVIEPVAETVFNEDKPDSSTDINGDLSDSTDIIEMDPVDSPASVADIDTKLDDSSKDNSLFFRDVIVPDNPMQFGPLTENSSTILTFFGEDDNSHLSWDSSVAISDSEASHDALDSKLNPVSVQKGPCSFASQIPTNTDCDPDGVSFKLQAANGMPERKAAVKSRQLVSNVLLQEQGGCKEEESEFIGVQPRRTRTEQMPREQTDEVGEKRKRLRMKNVSPKCSEPAASVPNVNVSVEKEVQRNVVRDIEWVWLVCKP